MERMFATLGTIVYRFFGRIVPDPFSIAIFLTIISFIMAFFWGTFSDHQSLFIQLIDYWAGLDGNTTNKGIWGLLNFSMLMSLMLVSGFIIAEAPIIKNLIKKIASLPKSGKQGIFFVALLAMIGGIINWGFGLIFGAVLAREVGLNLERRSVHVHYPLLAAAGYMGMLIWHGGFSGSAPLAMTTVAGIQGVIPSLASPENTISLSQTIFSSLNLIVVFGLFLIVPLILSLMSPDNRNTLSTSCFISISNPDKNIIVTREKNISEKISNSYFLGIFLGVIFVLASFRSIYIEGIDRLSLTTIIMLMLGVGMLVHSCPQAVMNSAKEAARGCAGIMLLFPLYAGILVICKYSGLAEKLTIFFIEIGDRKTIPIYTYFSAALMNIFIPSGGGQWAIQGELAIRAGAIYGIDSGKMLLSVAFGDQVTNMLQPFWALPLLSITGVNAKHIVGYTFVIMIISIVWTLMVLLLLI